MPKPVESVPVPIERARKRFEKWRKTKKKGQKIPESLWKLAVKLGRKYGLNLAAKSLHLDYYDLKGRIEAAQSERSGPETTPTFVEVIQTPASPASECLVELESPRGVKMRFHLKTAGTQELVALGRLFWRQEG